MFDVSEKSTVMHEIATTGFAVLYLQVQQKVYHYFAFKKSCNLSNNYYEWNRHVAVGFSIFLLLILQSHSPVILTINISFLPIESAVMNSQQEKLFIATVTFHKQVITKETKLVMIYCTT